MSSARMTTMLGRAGAACTCEATPKITRATQKTLTIARRETDFWDFWTPDRGPSFLIQKSLVVLGLRSI